MPPVTGYETDDEWEQKTNSEYGREWRVGLAFLGALVGGVAAGIVVFNFSQGPNRAEARLFAAAAIGIGMAIGVTIGCGFGYLLDTSINSRYKRKYGKSRPKPRRKRRGKHWDIN